MSIEAIDHVQLAMPAGRENDARTFYEGILGLQEVPKPILRTALGRLLFPKSVAQMSAFRETVGWLESAEAAVPRYASMAILSG